MEENEARREGGEKEREEKGREEREREAIGREERRREGYGSFPAVAAVAGAETANLIRVTDRIRPSERPAGHTLEGVGGRGAIKSPCITQNRERGESC